MSLHHRPTFALQLPQSAHAVQLRLNEQLVDPRLEVKWARPPGGGSSADGEERERLISHVLITFRQDQRHFWSPWLNLDLIERDGQAHLSGRFSPHPSVWTGFAFAYMMLGVTTFFALVFSYSQWAIGSSPAALGVLPFTAAIAASMWWSAQIGQRLAREQMTQIRGLLDQALGELNAGDQLPQAMPLPLTQAVAPT
jgi:hypothetical protein